NDADKFIGDGRIDLVHRPMPVMADSVQHCHRLLSPERRMPCGHEVEYGPQAKQVATRIGLLPASLLWSHVVRRPGDNAAVSEAGVVRGSCQAKVRNDHTAQTVLKHDIAGF